MGFLFRFMIFIMVFFGGTLLIAYIGLRMAQKGLKAAMDNLKRKNSDANNDPDIIDVVAEPVAPGKTFSDAEKPQLAAQSLSRAIASASRNAAGFNEEYLSLANLLPLVNEKNGKSELIEVLRVLRSIKILFDKDPHRYAYSKALLAKSMSGADIIINDRGIASGDNFLYGLNYATGYVQAYILELSALGGVANTVNNEILNKEISQLLDRLERFNWLRIAYPDVKLKNEELIRNMLPALTHKLQMCVNVDNYGLTNRESADLLQTATITVREMNVALSNMLENALSWDLIQADAALETLRQELRLRGMY